MHFVRHITLRLKHRSVKNNNNKPKAEWFFNNSAFFFCSLGNNSYF